MYVLEVENLVKEYKGVVAVNDVNFAVGEGEIYGLLGPNGAGKTTTIQIITGLLRADHGQVRIMGKEFFQDPQEAKKQIGLVPQELALYHDLSALDNLQFFGSLYGLKDGVLKKRIDEVLQFVGLEEHRKKRVDSFSGGMKRRLNIGMALIHNPQLIIMDEPTVGIDPQSRNHILDAVYQLKLEGKSILYTTHYMEEAQKICDRIGIMDQGSIVAKGTVEELISLISDESVLKIHIENPQNLDLSMMDAIKGVSDYEVEEDILTIRSRKNQTNLKDMLRVLVNLPVEILSIHQKSHDLEDVFLVLTGKRLRQ